MKIRKRPNELFGNIYILLDINTEIKKNLTFASRIIILKIIQPTLRQGDLNTSKTHPQFHRLKHQEQFGN